MAFMRNIQASLGSLAKGDLLEYGANGVIQPVDIVGTAVGQLGHANGYVMVPSLGLHVALALVKVVWFYDFSVAAYGGGGNLSVNYGGGGPALTGVAAAAGWITAAVDKVGIFYPLATISNPLVENTSINLVSSAAPTQPGTAAGVIRWACSYLAFRTGFLP